MILDILGSLIPKLTLKFRVVATNDKDHGFLLRSILGMFFLHHEDLSNKEKKIQHEMIKTHKKLLKLYSDYQDAVQWRKEMLELVKNSTMETKFRSSVFLMDDHLFPLKHPMIPSPNKETWEKVENLVKGSVPKNTLAKQLDYIKEIDKRRSKSVSLKDDKIGSIVSDSETISMDDIAKESSSSQNNGGGSKNNNQSQKGGGNNQQNNRRQGYYEQ